METANNKILQKVLKCGHVDVEMLGEINNFTIDDALETIEAYDLPLTFDTIMNESIACEVVNILDLLNMDELEPYFDVYVNSVTTKIVIDAGEYMDDYRNIANLTEHDEWMTLETIHAVKDGLHANLGGISIVIQ